MKIDQDLMIDVDVMTLSVKLDHHISLVSGSEGTMRVSAHSVKTIVTLYSSMVLCACTRCRSIVFVDTRNSSSSSS
jgi:hypothetical protein